MLMVGMSNNFVSESVTNQQMAQLEPIMNKVDSSGLVRPVSSDSLPQHQGTSNGEPTSQGLPLSNRQIKMLNNLGSNHLSAAPKRKATIELPSGSFITPSKREKPMGNRPWMQQGSNKGSQQMQSPSNASRMQHSASFSKRKTQTDSASSKPGTPRYSNSKNQNAQMKESSKVQSESSESVRSKMRESLASALALVSQQDKPLVSNNDKPNDAANSSQCAGSASASADTAPEQRQEICRPVNSSLAVADSINHVMGEHMNSASVEDFSEKSKDYGAGFTNVLNTEDMLSFDKQDFQSNYTLTTDDVPFSDFFVKDELLQGNGLSWVLSDMDHMVDMDDQREIQTTIEKKLEPEETGGVCTEVVPLPELLASRIEEELFKLFGGVNKKYKEKGRSLLFNLKDRNNPELRERVMFGKIPPEQLCSMTAEELASKELSEWRIAKAEEFDKMVVLPDSDVDIRRLVRKTHKGEFQVEVEHEDNVPVEEVSGGKTSVVRSRPVQKGVEAISPSKPDGIKSNVNTDNEKSNLQTDNKFSITISSNDGTDPMQGLMSDDNASKVPDFPEQSFDEFMEALDSEPPFENLPVESGKGPSSDKDVSGVGSKSSDLTPSEQDDVNANKSDKLQSTDAEEGKKVNTEAGSILSDTKYSESRPDTKPTDGHTKEMSTDGKKSISNDAELRASKFHAEEKYGKDNVLKTTVPIKGEILWEGMLQPNISTTDSVISIFKSGEKTSTKDWPGFLEIKGRVRLDAFEKFLLELPQSRTRAIMVSHFISKGSTPEEQATLREVADSYILDERVGFGEPVHGVELYFCPPHKKTVEMLSKILAKEQIEAVNSIDNGLIGVIVWRKTNITTSISPTTQSHNKHSSKRQNFSRRQQDTNVNANSTHNAVPSSGFKTTVSEPPSDDDDDDVPPGFGPPVARVEDDLPEYNFSGSSNPSSHLVQKPMGSVMVPSHSVGQTPSRPAQQMRELVHKYGQNKTTVSSVNWQDKFGGSIQPWNDDDDDIPEWQPQINNQNQFPTQQTMHNFHIRPHIVNQSFAGLPQQQIMPTQYLQPPMNVTHVQRNFGPQWVPPIQGNNIQPNGAPPYGTPTQGTPWSQHVSRSRGL
ncbi:SPOC domain / Transcription elongation factor S-II protein [Trifolium repens]|nr:SPOC domain / Transcription elongation factor S-II protein [Trifolium repens]